VLNLPALGIGVSQESGAPIGVHVVGRAFDEESTFAVAEVIEANSGIITPIEPDR
jgi:amidase